MTMTRQEIFNVVWNGLKGQGFRQSLIDPLDLDHNPFSLNPKICAYRGENGCKCAFGHLIPDDLYDPKIENLTVFSFARGMSSMVREPLAKWFSDSFASSDIPFLRSLQEIHDHFGERITPKKMEKDYRYFAEISELTIPE